MSFLADIRGAVKEDLREDVRQMLTGENADYYRKYRDIENKNIMTLAVQIWNATEEMIIVFIACGQDGGVNDTEHNMPALQYMIFSKNQPFSPTVILKVIALSRENLSTRKVKSTNYI